MILDFWEKMQPESYSSPALKSIIGNVPQVKEGVNLTSYPGFDDAFPSQGGVF